MSMLSSQRGEAAASSASVKPAEAKGQRATPSPIQVCLLVTIVVVVRRGAGAAAAAVRRGGRRLGRRA